MGADHTVFVFWCAMNTCTFLVVTAHHKLLLHIVSVLCTLCAFFILQDSKKVRQFKGVQCSVSVYLASYPGHVGGGKSGLVSTVCACAKNPMISWGIVYHRLRTVNLYRILAYSSEACPSRAYPANMAGKSEDFDKPLKFALSRIGKGDFTLKAEQLDAIKCIYDGKDVFLWLPTEFGKSICSRLCRLFSTTSTVTVEPALVVA